MLFTGANIMVTTSDSKRVYALKQLGFKEEPFSRSADPRFLYLSPELQNIQRRTQAVVDRRRALAVIEGDYGMGKSTLARRMEIMYRSEPDRYDVIFVHSATYNTVYSALVDIARRLGLQRRKGVAAQLRELELYFLNQYEQGRNIVLIFDEAQTLHPDSLTMIQHFYNFDITEKLVQVLMFGQPEINRVFDERPEIRSRVDSWFRMVPLDMESTLEMIQFRCTVAGRKDPLLNEDAFIQVWDQTNGVPRSIVDLCSLVVDQLIEDSITTFADQNTAQKALFLYRNKLAAS